MLIGKSISEPTFNQFYDSALFSEIKKTNGIKNNTKIVSVGMFPSISEYNDLHTIDAYMSIYKLEFKHKFRKVIAKELDKSDEIKHYFDDWGNRCYIFSSELGRNYLYGKDSGKSINHLELNMPALKSLGCQYIFSAVPIENYKDMNLTFINSYTTPQSYWKIYVYKV